MELQQIFAECYAWEKTVFMDHVVPLELNSELGWIDFLWKIKWEYIS